MSTEPKPKKARAPKTAAPAKTNPKQSPERVEGLEGKALGLALFKSLQTQDRYLELLEKSSKSQEKSAEALSRIAEVLGIFTDEKLDGAISLEAMDEENVRLFHRCQELENVIERLEAEKIELVASDPERAALFDALGSINPFVHVLARTNQIYPQLVTESDPDAIDRIPALPLAIQDYSTRINSPLPKRYELAIEAAARMMIYASDLFDQMKDAMPEPVEFKNATTSPETSPEALEGPLMGKGLKVVQDEETTTPNQSPERVEGQEGKTEGGAE